MSGTITALFLFGILLLTVFVLIAYRRNNRPRTRKIGIKDMKLPIKRPPIPSFDLAIEPDWVKCELRLEHGTYETRITAMKYAFFDANNNRVHSAEAGIREATIYANELIALLDAFGFDETDRSTDDEVWDVIVYIRD